MPDIDANLAAALKQTRTAPMNFAFVAKGATGGKLLVAKKPIPPKEVADAKKLLGGGLVFQGRCVGEEGVLVFEIGVEPPGTLEKQLKQIVTRDAGLTSHVVVRQVVETQANPELATADLEGIKSAWRAGRAEAIAQLTHVRDAIKAIPFDDSPQAVILLDSIIKNLTPEPATRSSVEELRRYLATDDVVTRAHDLTAFDVTIDFRDKLLDVLTILHERLPS